MHQAAGASDVQMATVMVKHRVANIGDLIRRARRSPRIRNSRFEGTVGLRPVAGPFRVTPDALRRLTRRARDDKRESRQDYRIVRINRILESTGPGAADALPLPEISVHTADAGARRQGGW